MEVPQMPRQVNIQQAADFLNVSAPYLIKLLDAGDIAFDGLGTQRRVKFQDLRDYKARDDLKRRRAADDLTQLTEDLGLY